MKRNILVAILIIIIISGVVFSSYVYVKKEHWKMEEAKLDSINYKVLRICSLTLKVPKDSLGYYLTEALDVRSAALLPVDAKLEILTELERKLNVILYYLDIKREYIDLKEPEYNELHLVLSNIYDLTLKHPVDRQIYYLTQAMNIGVAVQPVAVKLEKLAELERTLKVTH